LWDHATSRVTGFEILPPARLGRPRIDVAVRISGLFRDVFPAQIAFYDQAVRAVSEADEGDDVNPLAAARRQSSQYPLRVFGAAPGTYGIGLSKRIDQDSMVSRNELGASYLAAASHAYGGCQAQGVESNEFAGCVADADAFIHVHDQDEQDVLDSSETVEHEGGFAAAARMLGNDAIAYHIDTAHPGAIKARTLAEEAARVVRARAANPQWVQGQMRHGHRGAAEIAQTIDNAYALAVLSGAVSSHHFELLFEATLGTPEVGDFLIAANPKAAQAIAKRFENAAARGFWQARRNSHHACIAKVQGASA
ncbi:MAG: cobaltochelatase subunit CobN, partial [Methylocapsa sp.]|nr:cobaltochelatase subunit CobN [Methylocapsa sp.]